MKMKQKKHKTTLVPLFDKGANRDLVQKLSVLELSYRNILNVDVFQK